MSGADISAWIVLAENDRFAAGAGAFFDTLTCTKTLVPMRATVTVTDLSSRSKDNPTMFERSLPLGVNSPIGSPMEDEVLAKVFLGIRTPGLYRGIRNVKRVSFGVDVTSSVPPCALAISEQI